MFMLHVHKAIGTNVDLPLEYRAEEYIPNATILEKVLRLHNVCILFDNIYE